MTNLEELYGDCWRKLARDEGHMKRLPPAAVSDGGKGTTAAVERRRARIVDYIRRHPDVVAREVSGPLRMKKDILGNDLHHLVLEGRIEWRSDVSNHRRYYVEE